MAAFVEAGAFAEALRLVSSIIPSFSLMLLIDHSSHRYTL